MQSLHSSRWSLYVSVTLTLFCVAYFFLCCRFNVFKYTLRIVDIDSSHKKQARPRLLPVIFTYLCNLRFLIIKKMFLLSLITQQAMKLTCLRSWQTIAERQGRDVLMWNYIIMNEWGSARTQEDMSLYRNLIIH